MQIDYKHFTTEAYVWTYEQSIYHYSNTVTHDNLTWHQQ